jgi:hypothetical protein
MSEKYQKGKIYKIVCKQTSKIYIGSTCEKYLSDRLKGHRIAYKYKKDMTNYYCSVFEILKNNDYYIELIENCPCTCKDELSRRERHFIDTLENVVNKKRPIVEPEEKKEEFEKTIEKLNCPRCNKCVQRRSLESHYKSKTCILITRINNYNIRDDEIITIDKLYPAKNIEVEVFNEMNPQDSNDDDAPPNELLHLII